MQVSAIDGFAHVLLEDMEANAPLTNEHYYVSGGRTQKDIGFRLPWEGGFITINHGAGWNSHIRSAQKGYAPYGFPGTPEQFLRKALGKCAGFVGNR